MEVEHVPCRNGFARLAIQKKPTTQVTHEFSEIGCLATFFYRFTGRREIFVRLIEKIFTELDGGVIGFFRQYLSRFDVIKSVVVKKDVAISKQL
jgi:hypothetical protein